MFSATLLGGFPTYFLMASSEAKDINISLNRIRFKIQTTLWSDELDTADLDDTQCV
jgi:hypothetical protein